MSEALADNKQEYKKILTQAMDYQKEGDHNNAIANYNKLLKINPSDINVLINIALIMCSKKQYDDSINLCNQINEINPQVIQSWLLIARCAHEKKACEILIHAADKVTKIEKKNYIGYFYRALGFYLLKEYKTAIKYLEHCLKLSPKNPYVLAQMAHTYQKMTNYKKAVVYAKALIKMGKYLGEAYNIFALSYLSNNECTKAIPYVKKSIKYNPKSPNANFNIAHCSFMLEEYNNLSWRAYEFRFQLANIRRFRTIPHWNGRDDLTGKNVIVYTEQGFGDTIQFARFAQFLPKGIKNIIFESQEKLHTLMRSCPGVCNSIPRNNTLPQYILKKLGHIDYTIPLISVPYLLGVEGEDIRHLGQKPYLKHNLQYGEQLILPAKVTEKMNAKKIALVWNINVYSPSDHRAIDFELIKKIFDVEGCEFFIMHGNLNEEELKYIREKPHIHNIFHSLKDFNHSAFALTQMDLIITIDTAITHLAGAIGAPCWAMIPHPCDWRWGLKERSIWYDTPKMKLYRQKKRWQWANIVADIVQDLKDFTV